MGRCNRHGALYSNLHAYTNKKIHRTMGDILLWGRLGDGKPVVPQDHKAPAQSIGDLNHSVLKALAGRYAAGNIRDADIVFPILGGIMAV